MSVLMKLVHDFSETLLALVPGTALLIVDVI